MQRNQKLMIAGMDLLLKKFDGMPDNAQISVSKITRYANETRENILATDPEFCEWTEYDYKTIRNPHGRDWGIPSMKDFKICPYCGKEIKTIKTDETAENTVLWERRDAESTYCDPCLDRQGEIPGRTLDGAKALFEKKYGVKL